MKNLYLKLITKYKYRISYSLFCKLKPFWILYQTLDVRVHSNINFIVSALSYNNIVDKKDAKQVAEKLCCNSIYNVQCLLRKCAKCQNNSIHFNEFNGSMELYYYSWEVQKDKYVDKTGISKDVKLRKKHLLSN